MCVGSETLDFVAQPHAAAKLVLRTVCAIALSAAALYRAGNHGVSNSGECRNKRSIRSSVVSCSQCHVQYGLCFIHLPARNPIAQRIVLNVWPALSIFEYHGLDWLNSFDRLLLSGIDGTANSNPLLQCHCSDYQKAFRYCQVLPPDNCLHSDCQEALTAQCIIKLQRLCLLRPCQSVLRRLTVFPLTSNIFLTAPAPVPLHHQWRRSVLPPPTNS